MKRCGSRCLVERRNQCRELQKWSRCLLTMIGFEQVSRRYLSRNTECRSIAEMISIALTTEPEGSCSTSAQDWSPSEKCPFCDGSHLLSDDCSEKDTMKMEGESESTVSDGEHYGADCSSQSRPEKNTANNPPENAWYFESSGDSQSQPIYMHPYSSSYNPPALPFMAPFVPLPEIAHQLYFQSLLQWSAAGLLQQYSSHPPPDKLPNAINKQYLLAPKGSASIKGKENSNLETNHSLQSMAFSVTTKPGSMKQTASFCVNKELPVIYSGPKSLLSSELLAGRLTAIYADESKRDETVEEEDQPLDLSSRHALEAATRCAATSSIHNNSSNGKRLRTSLDVISNKQIHPLSMEKNNVVIGLTKNATRATEIQPSTNKRNYSQADLDAAVRDIRCGRLGTRRASVVYGIPRSTLRNKIYKLEAAEDLRTDGCVGKKKHTESSDSMTTFSNACSPPPAKNTPMASNRDKNNKTETNISTAQEQVVTDDAELKLDRETGISSVPHSSSQEPINVDDELHHSSPVAENKKPLWSPFMSQQTRESKNAGVEDKKTGGSPANSTGSQSDWKRSRPKRGQYRKYNKDALDEAVRSVRRGEMSVHRAGSFYGVPHSTLEYKVKERNLMRTKRKKRTEDCIFGTTPGHIYAKDLSQPATSKAHDVGPLSQLSCNGLLESDATSCANSGITTSMENPNAGPSNSLGSVDSGQFTSTAVPS